ncbi:MAG: hypothetical protein ACRYFS_06490 [Janthinobacterium lividum]
MSAASPPETGGDTGRIRCLYCGANNFPASVTCWQCSRPLKAVRTPSSEMPDSVLPVQPLLSVPLSAPLPALVESPLAPKAAAALGMLFPYVGLPAGIIFLMLDDPRKTQLGWLMIGWSLAGTILSIFSLAATLGPLWVVLKGMLPHPGGGSPTAVPGMPNLDGDNGTGILLQMLLFLQYV